MNLSELSASTSTPASREWLTGQARTEELGTLPTATHYERVE